MYWVHPPYTYFSLSQSSLLIFPWNFEEQKLRGRQVFSYDLGTLWHVCPWNLRPANKYILANFANFHKKSSKFLRKSWFLLCICNETGEMCQKQQGQTVSCVSRTYSQVWFDFWVIDFFWIPHFERSLFWKKILGWKEFHLSQFLQFEICFRNLEFNLFTHKQMYIYCPIFL